MIAFAFTIFAGAFLLFEVQPVIAKYILPWFGGGPGVWTTCMLFFQTVLLAGYAYAHFLSSRLKPRTQTVIHCMLLFAALALLPIIPKDSWKPTGSGNPTVQILLLLAATIGLPYFALASTSPLMQHWLNRARPGASPYRFYALSNAGSLLALLAFPFVVEPYLTRTAQAHIWAWGLAAYVIGSAFCALRIWRVAGGSEAHATAGNPEYGSSNAVQSPAAPTPFQRILWWSLPACSSVLLLATTNKLCQDVAVVPFLWIAPLAVYLLSFIICFDHPRWYARVPFTLALAAAFVGFCWALLKGNSYPILQQAAIYLSGLFVFCMVCHGETCRLKPDPRHLTGFYLSIAGGSAIGALLVAVLAPLIFKDYFEMHYGLGLGALLFLLCCARDDDPHREKDWRWLACLLPLAAIAGLDMGLAAVGKHYGHLFAPFIKVLRVTIWTGFLLLAVAWIVRGRFRTFRHWRFMTCVWLSLGVAVLATALCMLASHSSHESIKKSRNFYGVVKVLDYLPEDPKSHYVLLQHGRITHGLQFVEPRKSTWPVSYYGPESGIGMAMAALPAAAQRFGVVGLGTGTTAAFCHSGDYLRLYEINPEIVQIANSNFTYLKNSKKEGGTVEIILGDARLSMEREAAQRFDMLVLDAFSSDAIPTHLLTREAFEVYNRHLKPTGVLAVHVSNHFLNLEPVVARLAAQFGYHAAVIENPVDPDDWWLYSSTWMLLTRDENFLKSKEIAKAARPPREGSLQSPLWTDDFASLFRILRRS